MAAPIPPMLKYSIVHNFLNSIPLFIKLVSKFTVCKALYFAVKYALRLRSPLKLTLKINGTKAMHITENIKLAILVKLATRIYRKSLTIITENNNYIRDWYICIYYTLNVCCSYFFSMKTLTHEMSHDR